MAHDLGYSELLKLQKADLQPRSNTIITFPELDHTAILCITEMAHFQQLKFLSICKEELPEFFDNSRVLEVGSWDTCGSIRNFFHQCSYLGVDIADGPGVDLVARGEDLSLESGSFDLVVSCECFEHNRYWRNTFANMIRLLRPGGLCIISCAWIGRTEHGTPRCSPSSSLTALSGHDGYYMNLRGKDFIESGMLNMFKGANFAVNLYSRDLYLVAQKAGDSDLDISGALDRITHRAQLISTRLPMSKSKKILEKSFSLILALLSISLGERLFHDLRYQAHKRNIFIKRKSPMFS